MTVRCGASFVLLLVAVTLGTSSGFSLYVRKDVIRDILDTANANALTEQASYIIQDNAINTDIYTTFSSLLAINIRPHALLEADRFIFDYNVSDTETVQYNISLTSTSDAVSVFVVNNISSGNLTGGSFGDFEIDTLCRRTVEQVIPGTIKLTFIVYRAAGSPVPLSIELAPHFDCNVSVPTTASPITTAGPTTIVSSQEMMSSATGTSSPAGLEKKDNSPSVLVIVLICVGVTVILLAVLIIIVMVCIHRRKSSKARTAGESPDSTGEMIEDTTSPTIRNDTELSRQMFNNAAMANGGHAGNGQVVALPGKSIDDDEPLGGHFTIRRSELQFGRELGKGAFGVVYEGSYQGQRVAVKTIKGSGQEGDQIDKFLEEAKRMKDFDHANVLGLVGICCGNGQMPQIVVPYMAGGDLLTYIREHDPVINTGAQELSEQQRINFAVQAASGMEYLARLNFVHRDLAARNCMLSDDLVVKIADFGLARDIDESSYYVISSEWKLPVRWMAPESLTVHKFSVMSDVWSYGVLLWEVFSCGRIPYPGVENAQITQYLLGGKRLMQPELCPDKFYSIMTECWQHVPQDRPTFSKILRLIEDYDSNLYQNIRKLPCYGNLDPNSREANHSAVEVISVNPNYGDQGSLSPVSPALPSQNSLAASGNSQNLPLLSPNKSNGSTDTRDRRANTQTMMTTLSFYPDEEDYESMKRRLTMEGQHQKSPEEKARIYENFTESEL